MKTSATKMSIELSFLIIHFSTLHLVFADMQIGFYDKTCPNAESIVRGVVQERFKIDKSVTGALLRMHFHDCYVTGCDASVLIDSTSDNPSEKEAGPNRTVRKFDVIDEAKARLEKECPSTVSCADIITLATRDSVTLAGGLNYSVPTGRRDGLVSKMSDVNLPSPEFTVAQALEAFKRKGFTKHEMVVLLGAHRVGNAHCGFFQHRFSPAANPPMNKTLIPKLKTVCQSAGSTAFLDQKSPFLVDNHFYKQVLLKNGILRIDQELASDKSTSGIVFDLATNETAFQQSFAKAMVKMGSVQVLVGNAGEVRKNCRVFNPIAVGAPSPSSGN